MDEFSSDILNTLSRVKVYRYYERAEPAYFDMQAFVMVVFYIRIKRCFRKEGSAFVFVHNRTGGKNILDYQMV